MDLSKKLVKFVEEGGSKDPTSAPLEAKIGYAETICYSDLHAHYDGNLVRKYILGGLEYSRGKDI